MTGSHYKKQAPGTKCPNAVQTKSLILQTGCIFRA